MLQFLKHCHFYLLLEEILTFLLIRSRLVKIKWRPILGKLLRSMLHPLRLVLNPHYPLIHLLEHFIVQIIFLHNLLHFHVNIFPFLRSLWLHTRWLSKQTTFASSSSGHVEEILIWYLPWNILLFLSLPFTVKFAYKFISSLLNVSTDSRHDYFFKYGRLAIP